MSSEKQNYEIRDVKVKPVVYFLAGLIALIAASFIAINILLSFMEKSAEKSDPSSFFRLRKEVYSPSPLLEVHPSKILNELKAYENERLQTYGWSDKNAKTVHIPIEAAMGNLLRTGLNQKEPPHENP